MDDKIYRVYKIRRSVSLLKKLRNYISDFEVTCFRSGRKKRNGVRNVEGVKRVETFTVSKYNNVTTLRKVSCNFSKIKFVVE